MIDQERARHLKDQWAKRTDTQKDDLLEWLLKTAWPTVQAQKQ
jgi:hypothetical protein